MALIKWIIKVVDLVILCSGRATTMSSIIPYEFDSETIGGRDWH